MVGIIDLSGKKEKIRNFEFSLDRMNLKEVQAILTRFRFKSIGLTSRGESVLRVC